MKECDALEYADLNDAVDHCAPEKIIDLAITLKGGDIKLNSRKVLHIHVTNKLPDGSLDYTTAVIYFASDYVVNLTTILLFFRIVIIALFFIVIKGIP